MREIRRRVDQGHREVVLTGINLGCFRDRDAGYDLPRLVREAGAIARARAAPAQLDRDQPRQRRARRRAARDADRRAASPRPAPVRRRRRAARDGPPLHDARPLPAAARAARRRVQPDERRHRRLSGRGRARRSRTRCAPSSAPGSRRCTSFPYSPRPGTATAGRRSGAAGREEGARRAAARALARARAAALALEARHATTSCSSTAPAAATATTTRRFSSTRRSASSSGCAPQAVTRGGDPCRRSVTTACSASIVREGDVRRADRTASSRSTTSTRRPTSHMLVIPERHVDTFREIGEFPRRRGEADARVRRRHGREASASTDYRVLATSAAGAGQTIFHLHWHVLGGDQPSMCRRLRRRRCEL